MPRRGRKPGAEPRRKTKGSKRKPDAECLTGPKDGRAPHAAFLAGLIIIVAVTVVVTYWPVLEDQALCSDDVEYLVENPLVQNPSWTAAKRFLVEILEPSTVGGYYQPLAMISLMLDHAMGGRPDDLRVFHRTSLALHVMNTCLVIVFVYMLFGRPWPAAMVGLIFGVHPVMVESIPWVAQRKTLLAAFFSLCCLTFYVRHTRSGTRRAYGACLATYVLALMSKPTSTPLPILMLLLDYWPLRRLTRSAIVQKVPFFVIGAISAVIAFYSQRTTAAVQLPSGHAPVRALLILCHNIVFYLWKIVWPANLSPFYPYPKPLDLTDAMVLAGVIGTVVLIAALLLSSLRTRALLVGWLWFFVAILPAMGVVGFAKAIAGDRFVYLPIVGLMLPVAWFLGRAWNVTSRAVQTSFRVGSVGLVLILAALAAVGTRRYLAHWKDSESLCRRMVAVAPHDPEPYWTLGTVLDKQGRVDEAIEQFHKGLRVDPAYPKLHYSLGVTLCHKPDLDQALVHFTEAVRLKPDYAEARNNLGAVLLRKGKIDQGLVHLTRALEINPQYPDAHFNRGWGLRQKGRIDEAIKEYRETLRIDPNYKKARRELEAALAGRQEDSNAP